MNKYFSIRTLALLSLSLTLTASGALAQVPLEMTYTGQLVDDLGDPLTGPVNLSLRIYDASVGPNQLYSEEHLSLGLNIDGGFSVQLGLGSSPSGTFDESLFSGPDRWIEVMVDSEILAPRQAIGSVPYAFHASALDGKTGQDVSDEVDADISAHNSNLLAHGFQSSFLGLGTTSPDQQLEVHGNILLGENGVDSFIHGGAQTAISSDANVIIAADANGAGSALNGDIIFGTGSNINTDATRDFTFGQAFGTGASAAPSNEHMRILGNGNVGIGTSAPVARLHVVGPTTSADALVVGSTTVGEHMTFKSNQFGVHDSAGVPRGLFINSDGGHVVFNRLGGNVGIGNLTSPRAKLDVRGDVIVDGTLTVGTLNIAALGIGTTTPATELEVIGEITTVVLTITSDRNSKESFTQINSRDVLAKVVDLPISRWQYKSRPSERHIGPMAQDFHNAFSVGRDDRLIATVDSDGVALAAIQGLYAMVQDKDAQVLALQEQLAELTLRMNRLDGDR